MKKSKSIFICFLMFVLLFPMQIFAAGKIDINKQTNLSIVYLDDTKPLTNVEFDIYQIATVNEYGEYTVTPTFDQFNIDITGKNDDAWNMLATTMVGYVLRDSITPTNMGVTNQDGVVHFDNVKQGLYLVIGSQHEQDGYTYEVDPFLVQLPYSLNNEWVYDVIAKPKNKTKDDVKIDLNVVKVWHDEGFEKLRPTEVVVQLLCNGKVVETITLNKDNNWRHSWKDLDSKDTWHVVEKQLIEYHVIVEKEGNTFVIHNTYIPDVPPSPPGLDDTGVLWWPVPILLVGGLFFICMGCILNKKNGYNNEI